MQALTEGHIAADIIISGRSPRQSVGHLRLPTNLVQMASPGRRAPTPGGSGRFQNKCDMKLQGMNPRLHELVALAVLAAVGCGLALSQGDLLL